MTRKRTSPDEPGPFGRAGDAALPLDRLLAEIDGLRMGGMTLDGAQMDLMVRLALELDARDYLEIGCFAGLNVLQMALRGPPGMRLRALDISLTHAERALSHWREAGVDSRIVLDLQSALLTLRDWREAGVRERFDLILLDADKEPTPLYFDHCLELLRPRGILVVDNVGLGGRVPSADDPGHPPSVGVMAGFLKDVMADPGLEARPLPLGDGTLLVRKRS